MLAWEREGEHDERLFSVDELKSTDAQGCSGRLMRQTAPWLAPRGNKIRYLM
jgi:hypothetical protein